MASDRERRRREAMAEIVKELEAEGGIGSFHMWRLRDAAGYGKLGSNVVVDIANLLSSSGVGHLPAHQALPRDQYDTVRLYLKNHTVGAIVEAVIAPSGQGDTLLRELADTDVADASEILDQIRAIVCGP